MVNLSSLIGSKVYAKDGQLGEVDDVLFDDRDWTIRFVTIDIGSWMQSSKVLVSPSVIGHLEKGMVGVYLTRDEIQRSLPAENEETVSRRQDELLSLYYGSPTYWWGGVYPGGWGMAMPPATAQVPDPDPTQSRLREEIERREVHLRSFKEAKGYRVSALDDRFGHVEDLLADESDWTIRQVDVDTRNYLPSKHVLLKPDDISSINWHNDEFHVALSKEQIMKEPQP